MYVLQICIYVYIFEFKKLAKVIIILFAGVSEAKKTHTSSTN